MTSLGPDEFARLLRLNLPRMARLAVRLCGDTHAAEDIVGEALLKATRHYSDFRGDSTFSPFPLRSQAAGSPSTPEKVLRFL